MDKDLLPLRALQSIRLSHAEKDRMLTAILDAPPSVGFFSAFHRLSAAVLVVMLLAGSGISYAAESALPGDPLYPMKIHVNERLRTALARTPRARATREVQLAQRRLEEGETLATRGRMNASLREQVRRQFRMHAQEVAVQLDRLIDERDMASATEVSADFETGLRAHAAVLARMERREEQATDEEDDLLPDVHDVLRVAKEKRMIAQERGRLIADTGLPNAARQTIAAANRDIHEARDALKKQGKKNPELARETSIMLTTAEETLRAVDEDPPEIAEQEELDTVAEARSTAQEVSLLLRFEDGQPPAPPGAATMAAKNMAMPVEESESVERARARIGVADKRLLAIRLQLEKQKGKLTEPETKKVEELLTEAVRELEAARTLVENGSAPEALTHADAAITHTKAIRKLLHSERADAEGSGEAETE